MARFVYLLLCFIVMTGSALAAGPWEGTWQVAWPNGGGVLSLTQQGSDVTGGYRSGHGRVAAVAQGQELRGRLLQEGSDESFAATLGADGESFSGHTETGGWLSAVRLAAADVATAQLEIDLTSPRSTMRSFLGAGNLARNGESQALGWAVDTIDFGRLPEWTAAEARFAAAEDLFEALDLATFSLSLIPEETADPVLKLSLPRLDSAATVNVAMARGDDGGWRIVMPSAADLRAMSGGIARPADAFRQLQSPRDTVRAFFEGMARWREGGEPEAIGTIDISSVPEVLKPVEGQLMAQYIVRILDRVGYMPLQSIPNSGASREPFVLFEHPAGRIVIEPVGTGADTRWKFSAATAQSLRRLHRSVDELPEAHTLDGRLIPWSPTFWLRDRVKAYAPALLADVPGRGRVEYWQLIGALLGLALTLVMAMLFGRIAFFLLTRPAIRPHVSQSRRLSLAMGLGAAFAIGGQLMPLIGLPAVTRQYTVPAVGTIILLVVTYAAWKLVMALSSILQRYAEGTESPLDNILLTFGAGVTRLVLLAVAGLSLGQLWSLPTTGLLAGLGVGGLAVAFASKETLANVFGAGILLGDRPFRTGDRIMAGEVNGWVEEVGLRSTRIRTIYDSLMIVPNGKLADMTINNLGARRRRTLSTTVTVTGGSTPEKLRAFTQAILGRIAADPAFVPGPAEVNIAGITASGIEVEVSAMLHTRSGREYRQTAHQLFLDILHMAEAQGLSLGGGTDGQAPAAAHA